MRIIMPLLIAALLAAGQVQAQPRGTGKESRSDTGKAPHHALTHCTERSETCGVSGGKERVARIYTKPRYYREKGEWKAVDLTARTESLHGFSRAVRGKGYTSRFDPSRPERGLRFERDGNHVTYTPTGNWAGRTVHLKHDAGGVKETVTLSSGTGTTVCWKVETNVRASKRDGGLVFSDAKGIEVFRVPRLEAWDGSGKDVPVTVSLDGDTLTCRLAVPPDAEWPVFLDPSTVIGDVDAKTGYIMGRSTTSYASARDTTSAAYPPSGDFVNMVGQRNNGGIWEVIRNPLVFDTSLLPDNAIIDSAKVMLVTNYDGTAAEFDMKLAAATFTGSWSMSWYNDFVGWKAGSAHTVTALSNTVNSATCHTVNDTLRFTLNAAGLDSINLRGESKYMLLSARDINRVQPTLEECLGFEDDSPCMAVWYHLTVIPPSNFTMTALDSSTVVCTWDDMSGNEQRFLIFDHADSSVVDTLAANAEADIIRGLAMNTRHIWSVIADSSGVRGYSNPDTVWTPLAPPQIWQAHILPLGSDTLRVSVDAPPNGISGMTGMEVKAVSGPGANGSGWLTGSYSHRDGGLNPDSTYVYRIRYRNGAGDSTVWSPELRYVMRGRATLTIDLPGDAHDDYTVNSGVGERDSTAVRVGKSDSGQRLDGFLSFPLPWTVQKGGVDSMFVTLIRTGERSGSAPTVKVRAVGVKNLPPVETLNLGAQDTTSAMVSWTINSAAGNKKSPNLRALFRAWQDIPPSRDYAYGFGLRLDGIGVSDSSRAVFLDSSNPGYANNTRLTIHYTPGMPDTLLGSPSGLALTVLAPDSIRADWTDGAAGEYGYVLLNLPDSTRVAGTDTLAANTGAVTVGGLIPNTVHQWTVKAFTANSARTLPGVSARTLTRTPGRPTVSALGTTKLRFLLDPRDNPAHTEYAVQDSVSGRFVDPGAQPHTLRNGPLGEWGWRTFAGWGAALGDSVTGLGPNEWYGLRAKAR